MSKYSSPIMPKYFKDTSMPRRAIGSLIQKAKKTPSTQSLSRASYTTSSQLTERDISKLATNSRIRTAFFKENPQMIRELEQELSEIDTRPISRATSWDDSRRNGIESILNSVRNPKTSTSPARDVATKPKSTKVSASTSSTPEPKSKVSFSTKPTPLYGYRRIAPIPEMILPLGATSYNPNFDANAKITVSQPKTSRRPTSRKKTPVPLFYGIKPWNPNSGKPYKMQYVPTIAELEEGQKRIDEDIQMLFRNAKQIEEDDGDRFQIDDILDEVRKKERLKETNARRIEYAKASSWYKEYEGKEIRVEKPAYAEIIKSPEQQGYVRIPSSDADDAPRPSRPSSFGTRTSTYTPPSSSIPPVTQREPSLYDVPRMNEYQNNIERERERLERRRADVLRALKAYSGPNPPYVPARGYESAKQRTKKLISDYQKEYQNVDDQIKLLEQEIVRIDELRKNPSLIENEKQRNAVEQLLSSSKSPSAPSPSAPSPSVSSSAKTDSEKLSVSASPTTNKPLTEQKYREQLRASSVSPYDVPVWSEGYPERVFAERQAYRAQLIANKQFDKLRLFDASLKQENEPAKITAGASPTPARAPKRREVTVNPENKSAIEYIRELKKVGTDLADEINEIQSKPFVSLQDSHLVKKLRNNLYVIGMLHKSFVTDVTNVIRKNPNVTSLQDISTSDVSQAKNNKYVIPSRGDSSTSGTQSARASSETLSRPVTRTTSSQPVVASQSATLPQPVRPRRAVNASAIPEKYDGGKTSPLPVIMNERSTNNMTPSQTFAEPSRTFSRANFARFSPDERVQQRLRGVALTADERKQLNAILNSPEFQNSLERVVEDDIRSAPLPATPPDKRYREKKTQRYRSSGKPFRVRISSRNTSTPIQFTTSDIGAGDMFAVSSSPTPTSTSQAKVAPQKYAKPIPEPKVSDAYPEDYETKKPRKYNPRNAFSTFGDVKTTVKEKVVQPVRDMFKPKLSLTERANAGLAAAEGLEDAGEKVKNLPAVRFGRWVGRGAKQHPIRTALLVAGGTLAGIRLADELAGFLTRKKPEENKSEFSDPMSFGLKKRAKKNTKEKVAKSAYSNSMMKSSNKIHKSASTPHASQKVNRKQMEHYTSNGVKVSNKYF